MKNEIENIISLVENKNIDLAEAKILNLINKNSKNELYYNIYGVILLKKKNLELAELNLKKAVNSILFKENELIFIPVYFRGALLIFIS